MQAVKDAKIKSHPLLPEFTVCMSNPLSQLLLKTPHLFTLRTYPQLFPTPGHKLHFFFSQRQPWATASCVPIVLSATHISLTSLRNKQHSHLDFIKNKFQKKKALLNTHLPLRRETEHKHLTDAGHIV